LIAGISGSVIVFYLQDGAVSADILPPASDQLRDEVHGIAGELADAFAEMKRCGD